MISDREYDCCSDDWRRTNPDLVLYLPKTPVYWPEAVDHLLVDCTPRGHLLAIWTMAVEATGEDESVYCARSEDGGLTWTDPRVIDGPGPKPGQVSCFGFPIVSRSGRIYCFYTKGFGFGDSYATSRMSCKVSDDDGRTWAGGELQIEFRRSVYDHPDPNVGTNCIVWQKPIRDAHDRPVVGFTRWTSHYVRPHKRDSRCEFVRFDNIDTGPDLADLELTWLQDDASNISAPLLSEPEASKGYRFGEEPGLALLPDGRLFTVMRTPNGQIWYTVSEDDGRTWRETEMLRYRDGGEPMLNPRSPAPIYRLEDGRYLQFLQNHDGYGYGGEGPYDLNARRPQFFSLGAYRGGARQPIWFSEPSLLMDTHSVGIYPHYYKWLSMYASLTEQEGRRILWYVDRKTFALGRYITDEMLASMTAPE